MTQGGVAFPARSGYANDSKKNVGTADRIVRVIAGLAIGAAGIYFKSWWGLIALGPLLTASIGFCPAYLPLGISTCRVKHE